MVRKDKEYIISLILLILAVVFWGYSFISAKIILNELPPVSISFFRQIIASLTLIAWLLLTKSSLKVSLKHLRVVAFSSFFGIILYFLFENYGLCLTTASNASIIVSAVPVFTLLTETIFYKSRTSLKMILSIAASILGVYLVITSGGKPDLSSAMFMGNILIMGAMVSWVVYTMLNKKLTEEYSSILITAYQSTISIFLFIPFVIPEVKHWKALSWYPLLNLIYLGVFCSAFAYFFYIYASKRLGSTVSSTFLNLTPVVSVISGYFVLGEKLYPIQIAGMIVIMLSLFALSWKDKAKAEEKQHLKKQLTKY